MCYSDSKIDGGIPNSQRLSWNVVVQQDGTCFNVIPAQFLRLSFLFNASHESRKPPDQATLISRLRYPRTIPSPGGSTDKEDTCIQLLKYSFVTAHILGHKIFIYSRTPLTLARFHKHAKIFYLLLKHEETGYQIEIPNQGFPHYLAMHG